MTLDEARNHIGDQVTYWPRPGQTEEGTIVRVGELYVFVQYASTSGPKATRPEDLELTR